MNLKECPECKNDIDTGYSWDKVSFCPFCGYDLVNEPDCQDEINRELDIIDDLGEAFKDYYKED